MAWCLPIGTPHCTRSLIQRSSSLMMSFAPPVLDAGRPKRPVFSVVNAIRRPSPGLPIMFSFGTLTLLNFSTPFAIPFSPRKSHLCSTSKPSMLPSTMNVVICMRSFPFTIFPGMFAITTRMSAAVPFVIHSFVPLM